MTIGKHSKAKFAFYTPFGDRQELFFSIMGCKNFADSYRWYLTSSGFGRNVPNAMLYAYDPDTNECIGYFGKSWL